MNEQEWLESTDPRPMLTYLHGKASDRKLRLFAVACCRQIWHLIRDNRAQEAAEIAECFADGLVGDKDRSNARKLAQQAAQSRGIILRPDSPKWERRAASTVYYATARNAMEAAYNAPCLAVEAVIWKAGANGSYDSIALKLGEQILQVNAIVDIFGNAFRPATTNPIWLTWNDSAVRKIAQTIYDERAFDRMPILADALEDAGCDNEDILRHCRSDSPHVKGYWVVDLVLGKE